MKQAKIFLADERGVTETEWFRSYNTFNFGNYQTEHKLPVEKLYVCNDDTLAAGKSFSLTVDEATQLLLLPVVGAVEFKKNNEEAILINSGEVLSVALVTGDVFEITNPYQTELVNFLHFWLKADESNMPATQLHAFDINSGKNNIVPLPVAQTAHIAKLDGRKEIVYKPAKDNNCVFAFVIQGAFETEGILLHARDSAAFWNYEQIESEALSNNAIILLLDVKD